jgi:hypothetical protein
MNQRGDEPKNEQATTEMRRKGGWCGRIRTFKYRELFFFLI